MTTIEQRLADQAAWAETVLADARLTYVLRLREVAADLSRLADNMERSESGAHVGAPCSDYLPLTRGPLQQSGVELDVGAIELHTLTRRYVELQRLRQMVCSHEWDAEDPGTLETGPLPPVGHCVKCNADIGDEELAR